MKHYLSFFAAAAASLCLAHLASAQTGSGVMVSLVLASGNPSQLTPGSLLTYNLNVSGLKGSTNNPGSPVVGGFDLALDYDPSFLTASGYTFGTYLGPNDFQDTDFSVANQAFLSDSASASAQALVAQQPSAFTLATLTFTVVKAGTSAITYDPSSSMSNENSGTLDVVSYTGATVPEPSTYALTLLGAAGLVWYGTGRRRAKVA